MTPPIDLPTQPFTSESRTREQHILDHVEVHQRVHSLRHSVMVYNRNIQAAMDAANAAGGGTVFVPNGTYVQTQPLQMRSHVRLVFESRAAVIRNNTTNVFEGSASYFDLIGGTIIASAGHIFAPTDFWKNTLRDCWLFVTHPEKSIFTMDVADDKNCLWNTVDGCYFEATPQHTVPVWMCKGLGNANCNTFRNLVCKNSGNYMFWFETKPGKWLRDNAFRDVSFECTNGGALWLSGCDSAVIDNCHVYDLHVNGDVTRSGLVLTGDCKNCRVESFGRYYSVLGPDLYDIDIDNARRTTLTGCSAEPESGYKLNIGALSTNTQFINDAERGTVFVA